MAPPPPRATADLLAGGAMPDTEELLPDAEPEIHDDVATKHKLKGLVDSFPGFDGDMREGTRQRREKEQAKVTAMRMEMSRLEAALTEQTQLRAEMNETIQKYCDEQMDVKWPATGGGWKSMQVRSCGETRSVSGFRKISEGFPEMRALLLFSETGRLSPFPPRL